MALPELRWYDSDGVTPVGALALSPIGPGETYSVKYGAPRDFVLKNDGAVPLTVTVAIQQVSGFAAHAYTRVAVGVTQPAPGDFVDHLDPALAVGALAPAESARIWVDVIVPPTEPRGIGQGVNLRAAGV